MRSVSSSLARWWTTTRPRGSTVTRSSTDVDGVPRRRHRQHPGPDGGHLHGRVGGDDRGEAAAEGRLEGLEAAVLDGQGDGVAGQARAERGRDPGRHLPAPGRARREDRPGPGGGGPPGDARRPRPPRSGPAGRRRPRDRHRSGPRDGRRGRRGRRPRRPRSRAPPATAARGRWPRPDRAVGRPGGRRRPGAPGSGAPGPVRRPRRCTGPSAPDGGATGATSSTGGAGSSTPRSSSTSTRRSTWRQTGPSRISPTRSTSSRRTSPTEVGLASLPHGPAPRSAADRVRNRSAGTAARASGRLLARVDQALGTGQDGGQGHGGVDPLVVVLQTDLHLTLAQLELPDPGGEGQVEELGQLRADLAGVGVDGVAAHQHEVERALTGPGRRPGPSPWPACRTRRRRGR